MNKVLIITYYWPPAGGPGVQRILKFTKYLREYGWEPIVLTVMNGEYPAIDKGLVKEVPQDIKVYRTKTIEFFSLFKLIARKKEDDSLETFILDKDKPSWLFRFSTFVRSNFFIPDGRIGWYRYAVNRGLKIIKDENIDIILSSSPPHTVQVVAYGIKMKSNIPWIADFRDPWTDAFWESKIRRIACSQKRIENQERQVFKKVDYVITATDSFKRLFEQKFGLNNITTITNGYDLSDFNHRKPTANNTSFIISHTGSIAESQNPKLFLKAVKHLHITLNLNLRVNLYGAIDSIVSKTISSLELEDIVTFHGYVPHKEITEIMQHSDLLIVLIPEGRGDIIPGKLFEYMASGNTILCLGPKGDASDIVMKNNFGGQFRFDEDCSAFIQDEYKIWLDKKRSKREPPKEYSRRNLTGRLASILNDVAL